MPENPNEGNPSGDGTQAANPSASTPNSQPLPEYVNALVKRMDELETQNRSLQSEKDKRIPKIEDTLKTLAEHLGVSDPKLIAQAQREVLLDELIRERMTPAPQVNGNGNPQTPTPAVDVTGIASQYSLNLNDPEVMAALKPNMDALQVTLALGKVAVAKASKPTPSSAQTPTPTNGTTPTKLTDSQKEEIGAQLIELQRSPTANQAKIDDLMKKLKE